MQIKLKSKEEIKILHEGGKVLAAIRDEVGRMVRPGMTTGKLEEKACALITEAGGRPSFKGYGEKGGKGGFPTALCTSINDEVVHAPALPSRVLKEGDIIGIDIGMEYPYGGGKRGYYTDTAITVAVGKVSSAAEKLMAVTQEALMLGIEQAIPGKHLSDIAKAIEGHAKKHGFGVVKELVGHGVGYAVHEAPSVPNFVVKDGSIKDVMLQPGLVIAIEPMFNEKAWRIKVLDDKNTIATADGKLSAHFEHTVAVVEGGNIVLTGL